MSNLKQIIIIRRDLWMRPGKEIAQGAHASVRAALEHADIAVVSEWLDTGGKKIVCKVQSEQELLTIGQRALDAGLSVYLVQDHGLTDVAPGTRTALAIGPDAAEKIDPITGELPLY